MTPNNVKRPKIRFMLLAFMAGFIGIVILILWLLQVIFIDDIHKSVRISETKEAATELSKLARTPLLLETESNRISKKYGICIIAYRLYANGAGTEKILSNETLNECVIHSFSTQDIMLLHTEAVRSRGVLQKYRNTNNGKTLIYAFIVKDTRGNDIFFVIDSPITPVGSTAKTLNYLLLIIGAVMIILAFILTLVLSKAVTKPIADISRSAKKLAGGDYNVHFNSGSYHEINELAETLNYATSELSRVDKLRSELIANTTHDLRTPLTMITGYAELMRDFENENTPENAGVIADEAKRMTSLVNDMLEVSKLENGVAKANFETFNITEAVEAEIEKYSQFCRNDRYTLRFEANESVTVVTDRTKIIRALLNLVNNALTYTGNDKTVIVRQDVYFTGHNNALRYSVIDSGEGIPEDKLPMIWDRYYKVDSPHKRSVQGSGLGLSIVNKLMTLIDGRCGVLSSQGNGSIFWIEIDI